MARTKRVDPTDLVTITDIARLLDVKRSTANMWDQRRESRNNGFPRPVATPLIATGKLFVWPDVAAWFEKVTADA